MKKIIAVEFAKWKKFHVIKIILACYLIAVPAWMLFMNWFFNKNQEIKAIFTNANLFDFPHVYSFTTYCASFFNILLAVIVVMVTSFELEHKTMRQNIIEGSTKLQVILGKFSFIVALSLIATLITFLSGLIIGLSAGSTGNAFANIHFNIYYFLQTLGYFSFAFLFALIVKRPALSIITFIVYFPIETILGYIISPKLYQFFPLKVFADLTPKPFFQQLLAAREKAEKASVFVLEEYQKLGLSAVYILLFFGLTFYILKKRDL